MVTGELSDLTFCVSLVSGEEVGVSCPHIADASAHMRIDLLGQDTLDNRQHILNKRLPASHPLIVRTPIMVVWPVQSCTGKEALQPTEDCLVPSVHLEGNLRLLAVPTKVPLPDEQARDKPPLHIC